MSSSSSAVTTKTEQENKDLFCDDETLDKVKEQLDQLVENNKELIDEDDYRSLINDTKLLRRYIKRKRNHVEPSVQFIFETLQWRKRNQINNFKETDFPKEFYECGGLYLHGKDVNGNFVLHIRTKLYQKISQISDLLKKFTIFMMYKADKVAADANSMWVLVFDCTEAGILNADLEMATFVVQTIRQYFPYGQSYALIHNCPWFLVALRNIIFTMLPHNVRKVVRFSNEKNIGEFIDKDNLPDYLGGSGDKNKAYRYIPENLKTTVEMLKINDEDYKKVKKYYDKSRTIIEETKGR